MNEYLDFLAHKMPRAAATGIADPAPVPKQFFPLQSASTRFALKRGRAALFLDTGLGKTACELEFSRQAAKETKRPALILCPLAVAHQIVREAQKFGFAARVVREQRDVWNGVNVCNYDRMHKLDLSAFGSVTLDESSVLKNASGKTTNTLIEAFAQTPFRLCASATPAPNDYIELGTHAEFLGICTGAEMLAQWFMQDRETSNKFRLKRHAVAAFWDWVASWAMMASSPADLGFDASRFVLPELVTHSHKTIGDTFKRPKNGFFATRIGATTMHDTKRGTIRFRAQAAAHIATKEPDEPWAIWCDTDYEADELRAVLPYATEVRGSQSADEKEAGLIAFSSGEAKIIITKPSLAGFGLNWQHCARMLFVGRSFSYETWYQAVRRCWRFGQSRPVHVHLIVADGEDQIGDVIALKAAAHDRMKVEMLAASRRAHGKMKQHRVPYDPKHQGRLPTWLTQ